MPCPLWCKTTVLLIIYTTEPASTLFFWKIKWCIKVMVIKRPEKIVKIKICIEFWLFKAQMVQNKKKVNISVQSTHSFAKVQTEHFLFQRKSSLLIFHFKSEYCLVVQHRKHGTETQGDTSIRVTRHCSTLYSVRKMPCFVLFFFLPYF